jgi:predicted permease
MQGVPSTPENTEVLLNNVIGTEYLNTVGIPTVAGRNFTAQDTATGPHVAMVNETLARRFFPNQSPLGHRFCICDPAHDQGKPFDIEIVGVVRDSRYVSMGESQQMAAYFPYTQRNQYFGNFSVRATTSPAVLIPAVRRAIAEANPNIAIAQVVPLADQVQGSIATQRLIGLLSAFFAILAVFLAAIGVYGLISYSVARRTSEIGIRLALGADARALLWLVLRESLVLLAAGLAIGLPIALTTAHGLATFLKRELFQVNSVDPVSLLAACVVICTTTLLAALIPARRASKVDPMKALRCD